MNSKQEQELLDQDNDPNSDWDELEEYNPWQHQQQLKDGIESSTPPSSSIDSQPLQPSNIGFKLLSKMGWLPGQGLGLNRQGISQPIELNAQTDTLGVGKKLEEDRLNQIAAKYRKRLETEIYATQSEVIKVEKKIEAQRQQTIQKEVLDSIKNFYCELCNKQYQRSSEFQAHLDSYDHNHKKRFKAMNAAKNQYRKPKPVSKSKNNSSKFQDMDILSEVDITENQFVSFTTVQTGHTKSSGFQPISTESVTPIKEDASISASQPSPLEIDLQSNRFKPINTNYEVQSNVSDGNKMIPLRSISPVEGETINNNKLMQDNINLPTKLEVKTKSQFSLTFNKSVFGKQTGDKPLKFTFKKPKS